MSPATKVDVAPRRRAGLARGQAPVVAAVSLGGGLGASARYGVALAWPTAPGGFPWAPLGTNVTGCAAIGVLMVLISEVRTAHRLQRPFLGTGVLGGFTTLSTYAAETQQLVQGGRAGPALAYLGLTLLGALAAVWLTATATRAVVRRAELRRRT